MFRIVSASEFEAFVRAYPRALDVHPPLNRRARFRTYRDATCGDWPDNVVAKVFKTITRSTVYEIRAVELG